MFGCSSDVSLYVVLNSQMRRIDLFCKLIGPLVISVIDGLATEIAILVTLGLNVISVGIEYFAIAQVFPDPKVYATNTLLIMSHVCRYMREYQPLVFLMRAVSILNSQARGSSASL